MTAHIGHKLPLKELFNREAQMAQMNFPESLKRLVVVTPEEHIYLSPVVADILTESTNGAKVAIIDRIISDKAEFFKKSFAEAVVNHNYMGSGLKVVALRSLSSPFSTESYTDKMRSIDTYNHEMGHLIVRNGSAKGSEDITIRHRAECAAEAFKALRHVQLFGDDTDFFKENNFSHAIIEGVSPIHYKDIVLQKVQQVSEEYDISKLSFKALASLAGDIAEKYHLSEAKLNRITQAFKPVADYYQQEGDYYTEEGVIKCIEVMHEHRNDHDIYRAGKRYLEHSEVKKSIDMTDEFWIKAFADMEAFEKRDGIVLNLAEALDKERSRSGQNHKQQQKQKP